MSGLPKITTRDATRVCDWVNVYDVFTYRDADGNLEISEKTIRAYSILKTMNIDPKDLKTLLEPVLEKDREETRKRKARIPTRYKLAFCTPPAALPKIRTALFEVGAGEYPGGKYSSCCFEVKGIGQFLPVAERGAKPTVGQRMNDGTNRYHVERIEEIRCEVLCVGSDTTVSAVAALKREHPYEEVPYEVIKLEDF